MAVLLLAGCGGSSEKGDAAGEAKPGAARILRAVLTGLLSNAVETREEPGAAPRLPPESGAEAALALQTEEPQTCVIPYNGPVTIIQARTPSALARTVADRPRVPIVYETEDTAIWEDGRVVTTDVENLGTHLNAVGWASNPMQILGAGARPGGSTRNLGWASATSSFGDSKTTKKRKKRRRRG